MSASSWLGPLTLGMLLSTATAHGEPGRMGPTLILGHDGTDSLNPIADFMYFVPLVSPAPVDSRSGPGGTQKVSITSREKTSEHGTFRLVCGFEVRGEGYHQNTVLFDETVRKNRRQLDEGRPLQRMLDAIRIEGAGQGYLEVEGATTPDGERVDHVTVRFTSKRSTSPVTIALCDIVKNGNRDEKRNELTARVTALSFERTEGRPKMGVQIASLRKQGQGEGIWARLKGRVVNLFVPPIDITVVGNNVMLDLGAALSAGASSFTFPRADRLH